MTNKEAIFVFTKDRPEILSRTLASIKSVSYTKYIIDDSVSNENQKSVSLLCDSNSNCFYLGKKEFKNFTKRYQIGLKKFDFLLREVGNNEWNLGYARNFALLYSKSLGLEKVLFTDDDINVPDLKLIDELFELINDYQFVGANISGLVDDSVLGHIATYMGILNERMISGGFMVFNPNNVDHFFLNNYNEDWIWVFLHLKNEKHMQTGKVFQELCDPLSKYKDKIIFQEFGEIALDGILDLYKEGSYDSLLLLPFWERMIEEREEYLDLLAKMAENKGNSKSLEIVNWVKKHFANFNALVFQILFEKYFTNRKMFLKLYAKL